ncbi:dihydropteroate synthase, partial [Escherichia coli]|uniref:dihydropteroate synthase n=1 Tax=Escherichia coli TaxID=562 RepID=UPI00200C04E4
GINQSRIIVDPGIGFGKGLAENLALLNGLAMLHGLGCPVMLGASRKRMIGALSNEAPVGDRLGGSLALALKGAEAGVQLLRVHDVAETVQALRVWRGCKDQALVGR